MAVTKIWTVRSRLDHLVDYVSNIEKVTNPDYGDLSAVLEYEGNDAKTEQKYFVGGLNCHPETAYQEMSASLKLNDKKFRVLAYHGYQSFKEGEVTAAVAHEIGVKLTDADAGKIGRIMDRLEFAAVDLAALEVAPAERETPDRDITEAVLGGQPQNPMREARTDGAPSEPRSRTQPESSERTPDTTRGTRKPESVREFLRERTAQQRREDRQPVRAAPETVQKNPQRFHQHQQPNRVVKKRVPTPRGR